MKITAKLQDHHHDHREPPPLLLLRAKIPITIFNLPFLSHFSTTTTHPSDLSLSLSTNFASGPSLKLSYATASDSASAAPPFSLTLKSGTGLFGSPVNSPLVISAHFSFTHSNPTFSLLIKPQFGSFSLRKSINSHTESGVSSERTNGEDAGSDSTTSFGFVPVEMPAAAAPKDILGHKNDKSNSIFKGIRMAAETQMPVAKSVALNFRWWANFSEDQMPVLRINKIGIQRVSEIAGEDGDGKESNERNSEELETLKGMCFWMKRELDVLNRVNREMKGELEDMKSKAGGLEYREACVQTKAMKGYGERPSSGFEQWRSKRNGGTEENGKKEDKTSGGGGGSSAAATDVENELQRAIMAATASP